VKKGRPPLGDLEHELLQILWQHGEMTATAVRGHVTRKLKDPTIRTVLRRLEEKGYVDRFCGGSIERALLGLADAGMIDANQLAAIAGKLKRRSR
jgi:BlaI family penicillinase repressor